MTFASAWVTLRSYSHGGLLRWEIAKLRRLNEQRLGPDHFDLFSPLMELAIVYEARGRTLEAEQLKKRAHEIGIKEKQRRNGQSDSRKR